VKNIIFSLFFCASLLSQRPYEIYPIEQNGKVGFINKNGSIVVEPKFDFADATGKDSYTTSLNGRYGLLGGNGKTILPNVYDQIEAFDGNFARVTQSGKQGYIDSTGQFIIQLTSEQITDVFPLGAFVRFALYEKSGRYRMGLVDRKGNLLLRAVYDNIELEPERPLEDGGVVFPGYYRIWKDNMFGLLNADGKSIAEPKYTFISPFQSGVAVVSTTGGGSLGESGQYICDGGCGLLGENGDVLTQPQFESIREFSEGLAVAVKDGKSGVINKKGNAVVFPQYDEIRNFSDGVAWFQKDGQRGLLDASGKIVITPSITFSEVHDFWKGVAWINMTLENSSQSGWWLVNKQLTKLSDQGFYSVEFGLSTISSLGTSNAGSGSAWRDELARVTFNDGLYGYVNRKGKVVWKQTSDP